MVFPPSVTDSVPPNRSPSNSALGYFTLTVTSASLLESSVKSTRTGTLYVPGLSPLKPLSFVKRSLITLYLSSLLILSTSTSLPSIKLVSIFLTVTLSCNSLLVVFCPYSLTISPAVMLALSAETGTILTV